MPPPGILSATLLVWLLFGFFSFLLFTLIFSHHLVFIATALGVYRLIGWCWSGWMCFSPAYGCVASVWASSTPRCHSHVAGFLGDSWVPLGPRRTTSGVPALYCYIIWTVGRDSGGHGKAGEAKCLCAGRLERVSLREGFVHT